MDEKLTVLIPTKNRYQWIERVLTYYNLRKIKFKIIIADSSDYKIFLKNKNNIFNYNKLNIKHYYYPNLNIENALKRAARHIKTKYSVFFADDDMLLPSGLREAIKIFDKDNGKIIAVTGKAKLISIKNSNSFGKIIGLHNYKIRSFMNDNNKVRISNFISHTTNINFSVMRTSTFKNYYNFVTKLPIYYQTYYFGEILPAIWLLNKGKLYKLNKNYLIRQGHQNNLFHKIEINKFFFQNDFSKMLKIFDELQKKIFSKNDHSICTINKKKILNEIYNIFFNKNIKIKKGLFFFILNFSKRIISKIKLIKFYLIHNNDPETQSYLKVIEKK